MLRFAAVVLSASMLAVTSGAQVPIPPGDGTMLALTAPLATPQTAESG